MNMIDYSELSHKDIGRKVIRKQDKKQGKLVDFNPEYLAVEFKGESEERPIVCGYRNLSFIENNNGEEQRTMSRMPSMSDLIQIHIDTINKIKDGKIASIDANSIALQSKQILSVIRTGIEVSRLIQEDGKTTNALKDFSEWSQNGNDAETARLQ